MFSFSLLVSPGQAAELFQDRAWAAGGWHAEQLVSCPGQFLRQQWTCRKTQNNKVNCSRNTAQGNNSWTILNSLTSHVKCVLLINFREIFLWPWNSQIPVCLVSAVHPHIHSLAVSVCSCHHFFSVLIQMLELVLKRHVSAWNGNRYIHIRLPYFHKWTCEILLQKAVVP